MAFDNFLGRDENMDSVIAYFSLKGGADARDAVRRILREVLAKPAALLCSWAGSNGRKHSFKSLKNVLRLLLGATSSTFETTEALVADVTKQWLMFAIDQQGGRSERRHAALEKAMQSSQ
ncbi:uncharacterized protein LOC144157737 [Haemaphysalis longicornis]